MIRNTTGKPDKNNISFLPGIGLNNHSIIRDEICRLQNNVEYYLQTVFIMVEKIGYRLAVIHNRRVFTNKCYTTLGIAKREFSRKYNRKAWKKGIKPKWSNLYNPDSEWLDEQIKLLKRHTLPIKKES